MRAQLRAAAAAATRGIAPGRARLSTVALSTPLPLRDAPPAAACFLLRQLRGAAPHAGEPRPRQVRSWQPALSAEVATALEAATTAMAGGAEALQGSCGDAAALASECARLASHVGAAMLELAAGGGEAAGDDGAAAAMAQLLRLLAAAAAAHSCATQLVVAAGARQVPPAVLGDAAASSLAAVVVMLRAVQSELWAAHEQANASVAALAASAAGLTTWLFLGVIAGGGRRKVAAGAVPPSGVAGADIALASWSMEALQSLLMCVQLGTVADGAGNVGGLSLYAAARRISDAYADLGGGQAAVGGLAAGGRAGDGAGNGGTVTAAQIAEAARIVILREMADRINQTLRGFAARGPSRGGGTNARGAPPAPSPSPLSLHRRWLIPAADAVDLVVTGATHAGASAPDHVTEDQPTDGLAADSGGAGSGGSEAALTPAERRRDAESAAAEAQLVDAIASAAAVAARACIATLPPPDRQHNPRAKPGDAGAVTDAAAAFLRRLHHILGSTPSHGANGDAVVLLTQALATALPPAMVAAAPTDAGARPSPPGGASATTSPRLPHPAASLMLLGTLARKLPEPRPPQALEGAAAVATRCVAAAVAGMSNGYEEAQAQSRAGAGKRHRRDMLQPLGDALMGMVHCGPLSSPTLWAAMDVALTPRTLRAGDSMDADSDLSRAAAVLSHMVRLRSGASAAYSALSTHVVGCIEQARSMRSAASAAPPSPSLLRACATAASALVQGGAVCDSGEAAPAAAALRACAQLAVPPLLRRSQLPGMSGAGGPAAGRGDGAADTRHVAHLLHWAHLAIVAAVSSGVAPAAGGSWLPPCGAAVVALLHACSSEGGAEAALGGLAPHDCSRAASVAAALHVALGQHGAGASESKEHEHLRRAVTALLTAGGKAAGLPAPADEWAPPLVRRFFTASAAALQRSLAQQGRLVVAATRAQAEVAAVAPAIGRRMLGEAAAAGLSQEHWDAGTLLRLDMAWPAARVAVEVNGPWHYLPMAAHAQAAAVAAGSLPDPFRLLPYRRGTAMEGEAVMWAGAHEAALGATTSHTLAPVDTLRTVVLRAAGWRVVHLPVHGIATEWGGSTPAARRAREAKVSSALLQAMTAE